MGAGPGDPDLLTRRAARVLRKAVVVLADHLIPTSILEEVPASAEVIDVGKRPGDHTMAQDAINDLLVLHARRGKTVVRLKGGDPFVFGRGGEEALACRAAGVVVHVVPGISSAIAVAAAAGIPVTHRGIASSVHVISGHTGWAGIANQVGHHDPHRTLVLLMAMRAVDSIVNGLISAGFPLTTPVAVLERGWTDQARTTTGFLQDIAERVRERACTSPAAVIIGDVVALRSELGDLAVPTTHEPDPTNLGDCELGNRHPIALVDVDDGRAEVGHFGVANLGEREDDDVISGLNQSSRRAVDADDA